MITAAPGGGAPPPGRALCIEAPAPPPIFREGRLGGPGPPPMRAGGGAEVIAPSLGPPAQVRTRAGA
ncbi:hypothetical protein LNKW23_22040 [Paralimibaculum aggregatum]|uniref:Uncharacterized protein n=1 Tax=Paralimibaculum aggregatum TaxID=3036245 RepID=A0ABQ6LKQ5_9RHOB|nr:hypothetical protein LNKW23_22040 [Limibaculum sp. NKW23]